MIRHQATTAQPKSKNCGHTKPRAPLINLDQPGRFRVSNMLATLGISHSLFYQGMKEGRYPKPDGWDGKLPFWKTGTVREFLETGTVGGVEND